MDNEINEMIERVLIQRNKTVDDMILGEIRKIATENGIDTIITLNDKAIIQALKNFAEVKHGRWEVKVFQLTNCKKVSCSECGYAENKGPAWDISYGFCPYCPNCGAKMDGGKAE